MKQRFSRARQHQQGYVLLILLLYVAFISIGVAVAVQGISFQIKRDREEELIHRGTQYSRAVRRFIKAFGRYPNSIDELESTNNIKFLRKRYKDPISGKEFHPIHLMDLPGPSVAPLFPGTKLSQAAGSVADSNSPIGSNVENQPVEQASESNDQNSATPSGGLVTANTSLPAQSLAQPLQSKGARQSSSRGPIVGVESVSKQKTIREFDRKDRYEQWKFIYDPANDHGGLLKTPNQQTLPGQVQNQQLPKTEKSLFGTP